MMCKPCLLYITFVVHTRIIHEMRVKHLNIFIRRVSRIANSTMWLTNVIWF